MVGSLNPPLYGLETSLRVTLRRPLRLFKFLLPRAMLRVGSGNWTCNFRSASEDTAQVQAIFRVWYNWGCSLFKYRRQE